MNMHPPEATALSFPAQAPLKKAQKLSISASHALLASFSAIASAKLTRLLLLHFAIQSRNLECEVIKRNIEKNC